MKYKMSSEQITYPTEIMKQLQDCEIKSDKYHKWSDKSEGIPFENSQTVTGVGNGEEKLAKELDISTLGGQNSTVDLIHPDIGNISVKDMTNDNCTLGTDGCNNMRKILRTVNLFVSWTEKYKSKCELADKYYNEINKSYGSSKTTIINGIDRLELCKSNLQKLNELLNELYKKLLNKSEKKYVSLESEYIEDIIDNLGGKSLQELLDDCVRKEAITMNLIIVHKTKGWLLVKDLSRISCPRITRGAPRIDYS